jgi:hypothetical protein
VRLLQRMYRPHFLSYQHLERFVGQLILSVDRLHSSRPELQRTLLRFVGLQLKLAGVLAA